MSETTECDDDHDPHAPSRGDNPYSTSDHNTPLKRRGFSYIPMVTTRMFDSLREELNRQERHIEVLQAVIDNQPIGIVSLTHETGHPHHRVRQSLHILEEEDIIEPTPQGAVTTPAAVEFPNTYNDRLDTILDRLTQLKTDNPPTP